MNIDICKSIKDIRYCVDMYYDLNDHSFLEVSKEQSYKNLLTLCKRNRFVRVLKHNNIIIAWIYADIVVPLYYDKKVYQQLFYASDQTGIKAYKSVVMLHDELIKEAINKEIKVIISQGSHMDEDYTFTKILEKNGWDRRGYIAIKNI